MNYDLDLERQLLGTLITYPDSFRLADGLQAYYFYEETHRNIFLELLRIIGNGEKISATKLVLFIDKSYLASLLAAKNILDIRSAVDSLAEMARRRTIIGTVNHVADCMERGTNSADAMRMLLSITDGLETRSMNDSGKVTDDIISDITTCRIPSKTCLEKLDDCMDGGMYPKKAYGIAARKKVGKTIMLGTISHNLNMNGEKHLFICGEMGEREIQQRVLARAIGIYPSAFRTGYSKQVIDKIKEYNLQAPRNTIYLDAPGITFDKLKHSVVTAHMKHGIKGFILDYWQLVGGKDGRSNEAYHLGEVAQWIAEICRKLDIWALVAAQINQDGNTRGGEGMRLAFDQVYHLQPVGGEGGDITMPGRWLEMMDTRYTQWANIGNENMAGLMLNEKGLFFEQCDDSPYYSHG